MGWILVYFLRLRPLPSQLSAVVGGVPGPDIPFSLEGDALDDAAVDAFPPPVVELGGGRVGVADQVLDLLDGDVLRKQGGDDHDAEGVRRQIVGEPGGRAASRPARSSTGGNAFAASSPRPGLRGARSGSESAILFTVRDFTAPFSSDGLWISHKGKTRKIPDSGKIRGRESPRNRRFPLD